MFILPPGSVVTGNIRIPGGALIQGTISGGIICEKGSLILAPGSKFRGVGEADKVFVGGTVSKPKEGSTPVKSSLMARTLMAISAEAVVHADIAARMFAINSQNVIGSIATIPTTTPAA